MALDVIPLQMNGKVINITEEDNKTIFVFRFYNKDGINITPAQAIYSEEEEQIPELSTQIYYGVYIEPYEENGEYIFKFTYLNNIYKGKISEDDYENLTIGSIIEFDNDKLTVINSKFELIHKTAIYSVNDIFSTEDETQIRKIWENGYLALAYGTYENNVYAVPVITASPTPSNHVYLISATSGKQSSGYFRYSIEFRYNETLGNKITQIRGVINVPNTNISYENVYYEVYKINLEN